MADSNKRDDVASECSAVVVRHGPDCPVTKAFREVADQIVDKAGEEADGEKGGPSKYATNAYRSGYDAINWGGKPKVGQA